MSGDSEGKSCTGNVGTNRRREHEAMHEAYRTSRVRKPLATWILASCAIACTEDSKAHVSGVSVCLPSAGEPCTQASEAFSSTVNEIAWTAAADAGQAGGTLTAMLFVVEPQGPRLLKESLHDVGKGRSTVSGRFPQAVFADGNYFVRASLSSGKKSHASERGFVVGKGSGTSGAGAGALGGGRFNGNLTLVIEPAPAAYAGWDAKIAAIPELRSVVDGINVRIGLPRDVPVVFRSVPGKVNAWYDSAKPDVTFSYEFLPVLGDAVKAGLGSTVDKATVDRITQQTIVFVLMHELGHALRHQLDLPITGQEEDVVDEFATISLVRSNLDPIVSAGAITFLGFSREVPRTMASYFGEHALGEQRFANILCLLYGSDTQKYAGLVGKQVLASRAPKCQADFEARYRAWKLLFAPFAR